MEDLTEKQKKAISSEIEKDVKTVMDKMDKLHQTLDLWLNAIGKKNIQFYTIKEKK